MNSATINTWAAQLRQARKTLSAQLHQHPSRMVWGTAIVLGFTVLGFRLDARSGAAVAFITSIADVAAVYMMMFWLLRHVRVPNIFEGFGYVLVGVVLGPLLGYAAASSFHIDAPLEAALIGFTVALWFIVGAWHTVSIGDY